MINWWGGNVNIQDTWFQNFFSDCSRDYNIDHNDIRVISVFGPYSNIINSDKSKVNIYFTGENTYRQEYFQYSKEDDISNNVDAVCGFFNNTSKSIRLPLWMIYRRYDLLGLFNPEISNKNDKAIIVIGHDYIDGFRNNLCQTLMNKGITIDTNNPIIKNATLIKVGENVSGKLDALKPYKYNICCENTVQPGYTTEKIFDSFMCGCIPIYRGNNPVEPKVINQEQIIYVDNLDAFIGDFNPEKIWTPNALVYIYSVYLKLWSIAINKLKPSKKECKDKVTYSCSSIEKCIIELENHWKKHNNFYTPRAEFVLEDNTVLWMEDFADKVYSKYNLNF